MYRRCMISLLAALLLTVTGCASMLPDLASNVPPNRLHRYLGSQVVGKEKTAQVLPEVPVRAGLVLIADTTAPDAAPALGDEALAQMAEALRDKLGNGLRFDLEQILPGEGIR